MNVIRHDHGGKEEIVLFIAGNDLITDQASFKSVESTFLESKRDEVRAAFEAPVRQASARDGETFLA